MFNNVIGISVDKEKSLDKSIFKTLKKAIYLSTKRIFDICVGLIGVLVLIPLSIIIKILSLINKDHGNIIYAQNRIGKNGKIFKLYKFISMVPNAEAVLEEMLKDEKVRNEFEIKMKFEKDPRITKIGHFLRKTSIDELPQLINVLKGEMSLIGNRPYLPREKEKMGGFYNDIVKTKPGITGYWQVKGRNDITFIDRCRLESYYSNNMGLKMDIKIFFQTFAVVLLKKGAK